MFISMWTGGAPRSFRLVLFMLLLVQMISAAPQGPVVSSAAPSPAPAPVASSQPAPAPASSAPASVGASSVPPSASVAPGIVSSSAPAPVASSQPPVTPTPTATPTPASANTPALGAPTPFTYTTVDPNGNTIEVTDIFTPSYQQPVTQTTYRPGTVIAYSDFTKIYGATPTSGAASLRRIGENRLVGVFWTWVAVVFGFGFGVRIGVL